MHRHTSSMAAFFIECRLIGAVLHDRESMLTPWDSRKGCDLRGPPGLIFETGPNYLPSVVDRSLRNYETNHVLPFHDGSSMGMGFAAHSNMTSTTQALVVPVRTLASFAHGIGTVERVPWQEWLPFATPIELLLFFSPRSILHSRVLNVHRADNSFTPRSVLRVHNFSLLSRRRKVQGGASRKGLSSLHP